MSWPSPKDFTDALRNPSAAFADADLAAGEPVVGPDGRPQALTGDSSQVYQVCGADDRNWAVKCFTTPAADRASRYGRIHAALERAAPPFAAEFAYLDDGVRVGERQYPVLKMEWIEGLPLNRVARERAESPAALDALFQRWVRLSRQLRDSGLAHGDLQHGNVLLVPGVRSGTYTIKLIDYDGMYLPALADSPSGETGHPNYQHPARTAADYSADLDRFALLVVATALKGLSVLGPGLWERYDTGDNLLFTATDFQDPAASPLMRELWETNQPALQALVSSLAVACSNPLADTPWLDELAPDGVALPLSTGKLKAAAVALGLAPATPAYTVVDESESPRRGAATPKAKPGREPEPQPGWKSVMVPVALFLGLSMIVIGAAAGAITGLLDEPEEMVQVKPDDTTPPSPPPDPGPKPPAPAPVPPTPAPPGPPAVAPQPRPVPPPFAGPPGYYRVWVKPSPEQDGFIRVIMARDGKTAYVVTRERVQAFDTKTGAERPELRGPDVPGLPAQVWALDGDRVAVFGWPLKAPEVWNAKTGAPIGAIVAQDPLVNAGGRVSGAECQLSPDGKFFFIGHQGVGAGTFGPARYAVVEVATGKTVVSGEWRYGSARFTADNSRMFMVESTGRARWVKIPSGEVEIEWAFPQIIATHILAGMSADGALVNYFGRPGNLPQGNYLLDGKTGQVLRRLPHGTGLGRSAITADGKWVVALLYEPPDHRPALVVSDARTGAVLIRTQIAQNLNDVVMADFSADGRMVVVHDRGKHEAAVYELRGAVPGVPAGTPVPDPLTPVPPRAMPGDPMVVVPPMPPVGPALAPGGGLLPAPALKPRWTVATDTGIMANGLPQAALYSRDGKTMILSGGNNGTILTFDPKTGAAGAVFEGHKGGAGGVYWLHPVGDDRVVSSGFDAKNVTWDTKTAKPVDDVKFPELPPMPDGARGHAGITRAVSPSGRYTVAARKESVRPVVAGPLRVLDTTTGKEIVKADWNGGRIFFTTDESRVFVLDGLGKARWYKLPSGEADGEWAAGEGVQAETARVLGMTADGKTMIYHGPLAGQPVGVYLLEAKTGEVLRKLGGAPYQAALSAISPDGRFVLMSVIDFQAGAKWYTDVFETATWRLVGRITPPAEGGRGPFHFSFSPDGKDAAIFYPQARELSVFTLPDGVQAVVPPVPDPPRPGDPPVLKARWVSPSGVDRAAVPVRFHPEAGQLVIGHPSARTVAVFDAKTGGRAPVRLDEMRWVGPGDLYVLPGGKIGFHYRTDQAVSVWDPKAGKALDPIAVPDVPLGPDRRNFRSVWLSPDAKFMAVGRPPTPEGTPFRVFEVATGKELVSVNWTGGTVHFTADSSRVLVSESGGKNRWYKLPSGDADGGFELPKPDRGRSPKVTEITADGKLVAYTGPAVGGAAIAVLDGKTGEVVRAFGAEYLPFNGSVSADGKLAAVLRRAPGNAGFTIDVVEVKGGKIVGRAEMAAGNTVPTFFLTRDGRALVVHDYSGEKVYWFEVPDPADIAPKKDPIDVAPKKDPVGPPPKDAGMGARGIDLEPRWVANPGAGDTIAQIRYDPDARVVMLSNHFSGLHGAVDSRSGEALPDRVAGLARVPGGYLDPLPGGRVGVLNRKADAVTVLDLKTGKTGDPIAVPEIPAGPDRQNVRYARLSPDGKFLAAGRLAVEKPDDAMPLRVFDLATGKAVVTSQWGGGVVHFTADSSRVLVAESNGKCRWFKLPSGEADDEWAVGRRAQTCEFASISADGKLVGYTRAGEGNPAILDGKTGKIVHEFGPEYYYTSPVWLSADGRLAAVMRKGPAVGSENTIDVMTVADGRVVGRATVETRQRSIPTFQLTADGRALLVHDYSKQKLYWFDIPKQPK